MSKRPPTPWTDPKAGDVCARPAARSELPGKRRTVVQVSYWSWDGPTNEPGLNRWPHRVVYRQGEGVASISAETWAAWCRTAVREGGAYERKGEGHP